MLGPQGISFLDSQVTQEILLLAFVRLSVDKRLTSTFVSHTHTTLILTTRIKFLTLKHKDI